MLKRTSGRSAGVRRPWRLALAMTVVVAAWAGAGPAMAAGPELEFGAEGPTALKWQGTDVLGSARFAVERVVLEREAAEDGQWWGHAYEAGDVDAPTTKVDSEQRRITHRYPWGTASLQYEVKDGKLELTLTLDNTTRDRAIADMKVRLIDLAFFEAVPGMRGGEAGMTLDRPFWFELPVGESKVVATCESFEVPVQFGFGGDRGADQSTPRDRRNHRHAMYVWGGVPDLGGSGAVMPLLGVPHIPAGESLTLRFALRFADAGQSTSTVLRPYLEAFGKSLGEGLNWTDRRPIGRLDLPSSPRFRTLMNPRGWFQSPGMDVRTEAGKAAFREKLMGLADEAVGRLKEADAQGVVIWNLEGGHVPPAQPMGEPRLLSEIAPEMDAVADELFKKFSDAGFRTGVTIRPSQLFMSEFFQRWTQGTGSLSDPDPFAGQMADAIPDGVSGDRVYPLVKRMSDKIAYAKERWGCSIFYIHFNGAWYEAAPRWHREWMLFSGRTLARLRQAHPDVLLIPQYAHRHWRSGRTSQVLEQTRKKPNAVFEELRQRDDIEDLYVPPPYPRITLRDVGEYRLGGAATPEWTIVDSMRLSRERYRLDRILPGPRHIVRHSYWAHSAPYVELQFEKLIREYVLTLEQHMEYTEEQAQAMAEGEVVFETTPDRVREWMPDAFTTIDLSGAEIDRRRSQLETAAAWGDVLMWKVTEAPTEVIRLQQAAEAKKRRMAGLGERMGLVKLEDDQPLVPLSLVWRLGEPIAPEQFVAPGSDTSNLLARVAYTEDRQRALLMLTWSGGKPAPVKLRPDLPGIKVAGPHKRVWQSPTGMRGDGVEPFLVNPDPVAALNVIVVEAADAAAAPTPAGVLLGASFNEGVAPELGGGPDEASSLDGVTRVAGSEGQGLKVDGGKAVGFGVVPDWFGGTLEFDIKAQDVGNQPLRLFKLQHHLDAEVLLTRRGGRVGLLLKAGEGDVDKDGEPTAREAFAPLVGGVGGWDRVALTWEIGQYRLYVNGKLVGSALGEAELRRRDGTIFEPGIIAGGGGPAGGASAVLDSMVVYDWPFDDDHARSRKRPGAMGPAKRGEKRLTNVWLWGKVPEKVYVGVNARDVPRWHQAEKFAVTLYRKEDAGRRQVAMAEIPAYAGVAIGALPFKEARNLDFKNAAEGGGGGGVAIDDGPEMGGAGMDLLEEELGLEREYELVVQPLPEGQGPPARTIKFSASNDEGEAFRW